MKLCEAFVAAHAGEAMEYQAYPSGSWQEITVPVDRQPVDAFGAGLSGRIHVMLPKSLVTTVNLKQDRIRLAPVTVGGEQKTYTVNGFLPSGNQPGHFWMECVE
jgi:hypothetical protein